MGWFAHNELPSPAPAGKHALAALLASTLLAPLQALALESPGRMQSLPDEELRQVAAQGLADRFLQRVARYAANGLGIEVIGDMASLLNPLGEAFAGLVDTETTFRDAVFNPRNPSMLVDKNGSLLVRLPSSVGEIAVRHIRIRGSNGNSFGSATIRDVNVGGTTIRVTQR